MNEKTYPDGTLLPDSERLTKLGKLLRDISFDELPQLINVLKGDMSLIGPRPLLVDYLSLYSTFEKRRHEVRPGITGWAQINGRNLLAWEQKFKLDVWYVDNVSFWLDTKIFFRTILKIIRREGVTSKTSVTMEKFKGNL
jgi:lipopolysaccharide/colanic/teichoic acid biosynthesis glycosyltransferase